MPHRLTHLLFAALTTAALATEHWKIETQPAWQVQGEIQEPEDISGIAQLHDKKHLLVSDETRSLQIIDLDPQARLLLAGPSIPLLPKGKKELDLEAVTLSSTAQWCYVTGSHSVSRKKGQIQPERKHVFRLPIKDHQIQPDTVAETTLTPAIQALPLLRNALDKPSEEAGLDIEGLTERNGQLFFGLRSPSIDSKSIIIEVNADQLFTNPQQTQAKTHSLATGRDLGIRDIARLNKGYLLLIGPASSSPGNIPYSIHYWPGPGTQPNLIGQIPATKGKPEALLLLTETTQRVNILVLQDSAPQGQPLELSLIKQ
jgi:hypothetical protein